MTNPLLRRDIQSVPITVEGRQMITFMDPLKLSQTGYAIDCSMIPLIRMLDGSNDFRDLQKGLMRFTGGTIVPISALESFIEQLDTHNLLESEAFHRKKKIMMDNFAAKDVREPLLAGSSYKSDPSDLEKYLGDVEAGLPVLSGENRKKIIGLLVPHIDIEVARAAYVDAYRRIRDHSPDLVVIFGINHYGRDGLFALTDKDFRTPFGLLKSDREFVSSLKDGLPPGTVAPYDFDHMAEHSIEFQTIFLAHYLSGNTRIAPVLCSGIHEYIHTGRDLFQDRRFTAFRDAVSENIRDRNVLFISAVDFSHVGYKFGHEATAEFLLPKARANDETLITLLVEGSPEKIFRHASITRDYYNVCGLPSMIIFSSLLGPCRADLLHHNTYEEPATNSAVSFASMMFTRPD